MSEEPSPFQKPPSAVRNMPASEIAEKAVLCSFMLSPLEIGGMCSEMAVTTDAFYCGPNATVYAMLISMWERGIPIDFTTVIQKITDAGKLERCGGASFLADIATFLPTAMNARQYIETLLEKQVLRQIILTGTQFATRAYESLNGEEVEQTLQEFEQETLAIRQESRQSHIVTAREAVMEAVSDIQDQYERRGSITGLSTGFHELDVLLDGLHNEEMIVIGARPSQGKTALAMNMVEHLAIDLRLPVAVFSIEMSTKQLMKRMILSRSRVNMRRDLQPRDFPAMTKAASEISHAKIFFDDSSDLSIQEFRARARRLKQEHGIAAIFVDYLQLMRSNTKRAQENKAVEVSEVSGGLKKCSRELKVPVVVLAQISRGIEHRGQGARPRLSDLRDSGSIEQDADVVMFLTRPETSAETDEERRALYGQAEISVPKQRCGPNGDVPLRFLKEWTRFENVEHEQEDPQQELPV